MLTTAQFNKSDPGLWTFVYTLWPLNTYCFGLGGSWPGLNVGTEANRGWGLWTWIDGTNSSNLNCYTPGCALWGTYV